MMTIDGGKGNCLWGVFRVPYTLVNAWADANADCLFYDMSPVEYKLPPPDSIWYDCEETIYGPRVSTLVPGWINSTKDAEWNPCSHSTIRGNAIYRGTDGNNCPYILSSYPELTKTGVYQFKQGRVGPALYAQRRRLTPTNNTWNYLTDYEGVLFSSKWYNNPKDYYYYDTEIYPSVLPDTFQSLLPADGAFLRHSEWNCVHYDGSKPNQATLVDSNRFFYAEIEHPSPRIMVRKRFTEYHTTDSYTPAASISNFDISTGLGSLREAQSHTETVRITHIRSTKRGIFYIRVVYVNNMTYHGWAPYDYYSGEDTIEKSMDIPLKILGPGLTQTASISIAGLNQYCDDAPIRAAVLYDPEKQRSARTAAVRDVTALDSNWIENLSQVKDTMKVITPILTGWKAYLRKDLVLARRALAEAYLTYKYVISPAISDYENLRDDGLSILSLATKNRFSRERRRGRVYDTSLVLESEARLTYTSTIITTLKTDVFSQLWNALDKIGLDPSAGQLWDCVPFSFVADWFLKIGNTLRTLSAYDNLRTHRDLLANIEGYKVQWPMSESEIRLASGDTLASNGKTLEYGYYSRNILTEIGSIDPIAIQLTDSDLTLSQMVQGAALVTAYKR